MDARISIVAALSRNRVIGQEGDIPWELPDDLQRFKKLTEKHVVIVGRKTHESILHRRRGRPLPNRTTVVLTRQQDYPEKGCLVARSWEYVPWFLAGEFEVFVIGGEQVYRLALPHTRRLFLTRIRAYVKGDTFFPEVDWSSWVCTEYEHHEADERHEHPFTFETWERRKQ